MVFWMIFVTLLCNVYPDELLEISDALTSKAKSISQDSTWTLPQYDGVSRIVQISSLKELDRLRSRNKIVVVLYTTPLVVGDNVSVRSWQINAYMLEMTAQLLENQKAVIAYVDMLADHDVAKREGVSEDGVVLVYRRGRRLTFYGHRSPQVLMQFLIKACSNPLTVIMNKSQRQQFEELDVPKIVGYFRDKKDGVGQLFADVAESFHPNIPSFTVYDSKLAKQLKLKSTGVIHFHKPYERPARVLHINNSMSPDDIIDFINLHKRPILRQLTLQDVHSTWSHNARSQIVLTFVQPSTAEGHHFFRLLKHFARRYHHDESYSFLWINPGHFPSMLPYWIKTYRIDLDQPQIGLVNVTDNRSSWFDTRSVYHQNEARSLDKLQHWLNTSYMWQCDTNKVNDVRMTPSSFDTLEGQQSVMSPSISKPKDEL